MLPDNEIDRVARRVAELLADQLATPRLLLDQKSAAAALGISTRSFQRLNIPSVRLDGASGKPLYRLEDLEARIDASRAGAAMQAT